MTVLTNYKSHVDHVAKLSMQMYEKYLAFIASESNDLESIDRYLDARQQWENAVTEMNEIFPIFSRNRYLSALEDSKL